MLDVADRPTDGRRTDTGGSGGCGR